MTKTTASVKTPSPSTQRDTTSDTQRAGPAQQFIVLALDMSWRLAVVVLVPVIGGYYLGRHFKITAVLTIAGFIVAIAGAVLVVLRTAREADRQNGDKRV